MKRIKSVNGYTIYQATTQRDADNYNCEVGNYNVYLSSDIRDFGLSYSTPEWDDIDSLATAITMCSDSQWATACALAEEISGSTAQDMDLALEIERRLDAGEALSDVRADLRKVYLDEDDDELEDDLSDDELDEEPAPERRSHASYAVLRDPDDGQYVTISAPCSEGLDTQEKRDDWLLTTVSKHWAFSDCGGLDVVEVMIDGRLVDYVGWQPGMLYEYRDLETGEIVWSESFPQWNH